MLVLIESANDDFSSKIFEPVFSGTDFDIIYQEDHVGFGSDLNAIVVGIVFIIESSISGAAWDAIKYIIQRIIGLCSKEQVAKTNVFIEIESSKRRYKIQVTNSSGMINIELPDGIKIKTDA